MWQKQLSVDLQNSSIHITSFILEKRILLLPIFHRCGMCVQRSKVIGHTDRRIQSYGSNPCLLTPRADLANRKRKKKKIKFEQISEVEASQTVKLCLSQIKSGYNCYKVKLHIRFKARKKDKHHNNINTKKM